MKNIQFIRKNILFLFFLFLSYSAIASNFYWVGGAGNWSDINHWRTSSGGSSMPSNAPTSVDNVIFDSQSGFTLSSYTVNLDAASYCHNITVNSTTAAITIRSTADGNSLNIYGSSEWQSGMTVKVTLINYENTGEAKTIKCNGVPMGQMNTGGVTFNETNSITLLDDFTVLANFIINAGTWNTNNNKVTIGYRLYANNSTSKTINLGSSQIYMTSNNADFATNNSNTILNAGTSHIHFTGSLSTINTLGYGIDGYPRQSFYDVTFENTTSTGLVISDRGTSANPINFHNVQLKGGGSIYGYNVFNQLILAGGKTFYLGANQTQTVNTSFQLITTPCSGWGNLQSTTSGTQATLSMPNTGTVNVTGDVIKDIKTTGGAAFNASNSVNDGNNTGWTFGAPSGQDLYWVGGAGNWNDKAHWSATSGGSGGYCVPGPGDNVFFNSNSGFISGSSTVTLDAASYCHNIKVEVAITIKSATNGNSLNIYGSSEWQSGMTVDVYSINYQNSGETKTIKSNGVTTGITSGSVTFNETNSISLLDDFTVYELDHKAGTWNTNNNKVTIGYRLYANNSTSKTINLGSSQIYMTSNNADFATNNSNTILNAGTSHIHFTGSLSTINTLGYGIDGYPRQSFYDVTFENTTSTGLVISDRGTSANPINFHNVQLKGGGSIYGYNVFNQLTLSGTNSAVYYFGSSQTQIITTNLYASGNPCYPISIKSTTSGTQANIKVQGGSTNFNFDNIRDIKATGLPFYFGSKSTDLGNNTNMTFETYNSGAFDGLGPDWTCDFIKDSDPASYTISASGYYGNNNTTYQWTKLNDVSFTGILGTGITLDIRPYGYGTYHLLVTYGNGCVINEDLTIIQKTSIPVANSKVCKKTVGNTLADVAVSGTNIKWYSTDTSSTILSLTTTITDGQTYYVTQTLNGCESERVPVTIIIANCGKSMINPALPFWTK